MSVTVGVDIGGSLTKIIGFRNGAINTEPVIIRASDPLTSVYGAFGKFIAINGLELSDVQSVMITGLGASNVKKPIYGIKTGRVDEFMAIGLGGLYMSGLDKALVVSMGTGTAFIRAEQGEVVHMGGSGVGGGSLTGLARKLINIQDIDYLIDFSEKGDLSNVDLAIRDITTEKMALGEDLTVSNFGKISDAASNEDIALGLMNMTFQTIGVMSCFLAKAMDEKNIVLTGKLSTFDIAGKLCDEIGVLHDVSFLVPKFSEFATAAGAAIALLKDGEYSFIN